MSRIVFGAAGDISAPSPQGRVDRAAIGVSRLGPDPIGYRVHLPRFQIGAKDAADTDRIAGNADGYADNAAHVIVFDRVQRRLEIGAGHFLSGFEAAAHRLRAEREVRPRLQVGIGAILPAIGFLDELHGRTADAFLVHIIV